MDWECQQPGAGALFTIPRMTAATSDGALMQEGNLESSRHIFRRLQLCGAPVRSC
ncbi:hypothetical protein NDU88_007318, partial [Pleurodeles waltl]